MFDEAFNETSGTLFDDERSRGFGGDGYVSDSTEDSFGGSGGVPAVDSGYGQLPAGEVTEEYRGLPSDKDSDGFVDFQGGSLGF